MTPLHSFPKPGTWLEGTGSPWPVRRYALASDRCDHHCDFAYVRLHGPGRLYDSSYGTEELAVWARRLEGWVERGLEVFAYFDNDGGARAPHDARALMDLLE